MPYGLAAYPTDAYYDPGRPAWLPYWVDTPGENAQKWGLYPGADINQEYPDPPMPAPPGVPHNLPENPISGPAATAAIDAIIAAQTAAQRAQTEAFFGSVQARLEAAAAEHQRETDAANTKLAVFAAVGVGVLFLLRRRD